MIHNVAQDPDSTLAPKVFKIASTLKELSIWRHQGGGDFWRSYLDNITNLPNLRHLGFAEVTSYHDNEDDSYSVSEYLADDEYLGIYELPVLLPNSPLLTKFEVLIAEPPSRLEDFQNYPFDNFLALIRPPEVNQPFTLSSLIRNCRMMGLWDGATESDAIAVQNLRPKIKTSDNVLHFFSSSRSRWADTTNQEILAQVESADIVLHGDDDDEEVGDSLIFKSFVNYLRERESGRSPRADWVETIRFLNLL